MVSCCSVIFPVTDGKAESRAQHGFAPHRFGDQVKSERTPVAPVEGLDVQDRDVLGAMAGRSDGVLAMAIGASALKNFIQLARKNARVERDGLNAWEILVEIELAHIGAPRIACDVLARREHRASTAQHLFVGQQALPNGELGFGDLEIEAVAGNLRRLRQRAAPHADRCDQQQHERERAGNERTARAASRQPVRLQQAPIDPADDGAHAAAPRGGTGSQNIGHGRAGGWCHVRTYCHVRRDSLI